VFLLFDIHSHILPYVDDGAKDIEEALNLLKMMKENDITHIIATPHFYPQETNLEDFISKVNSSYKLLREKTIGSDLPKIYLGCELLYFDSLGYSTSLKNLCLNKSEFLLLELTDHCIGERLFENILMLTENTGIIPVIAHIERYYKAKNYKHLINFVIENKIPIQLNAASFFIPAFRKTLKKLLNSDAIIILGTDAHSCDLRPPRMKSAIEFIEKKYGTQYKEKLIRNSQFFFSKIVDKGDKL
jgi:protein-tyrosine phosphatase